MLAAVPSPRTAGALGLVGGGVLGASGGACGDWSVAVAAWVHGSCHRVHLLPASVWPPRASVHGGGGIPSATGSGCGRTCGWRRCIAWGVTCVVLGAGFEPARDRSQRILSPSRLPVPATERVAEVYWFRYASAVPGIAGDRPVFAHSGHALPLMFAYRPCAKKERAGEDDAWPSCRLHRKGAPCLPEGVSESILARPARADATYSWPGWA